MAGAVLPSESDIAALCARWKMRALSIFGSVARGEARPDSDIDLLVDFEPGADWSLSDRERLREEAAALFGRPADIVEARNVTNPYRRAAIQRDIAQWRGAAAPRSMTPRERDPAHLTEMLAHARDGSALRARIARADLGDGSLLGPAAERYLDKLGRAAAKVSVATRADHPTVPWDELAAMPSWLDYHSRPIDPDRVWAALDRTPALIAALQPIVAALPPPE